MKTAERKEDLSASERISGMITDLGDWRGERIAWFRALVHEAAPGITEEWKWSSPVWSQNGMVCSTGVFKNHVKLNFFQGVSLEDPAGIFNAGLDAKKTRSVDIHEGAEIDEAAL